MELSAKEFWLPKEGSSEEEYEDAFSIADDKTRFAVADGATETSFSGVWARQLVRAFTAGKLSNAAMAEELKPLQSRWEKIVGRRKLPWYAEEKVRSGAFAAFIGLELREEKTRGGTARTWKAVGVGDSCLVQVCGDGVKGFPLENSASFSSRPNLLSSSPASNGDLKELVTTRDGLWGGGDVFLLMTDALACWFFKQCENGSQLRRLLEDLDARGQAPFARFVAEERKLGRMKNDDVTLVRIDVLK